MTLPVRRVLVRGTVAAALTLGSAVVLAPTASADAPCQEGAARVFFSDSTNTCLGPGTTSYDAPPAIAKVCSAHGVAVTAEATLRKTRTKTTTSRLDLSSGKCGRFDIPTQISATVTVS